MNIPSKINNRQVVELSDSLFFACNNFIGDLTIPAGVKTIGEHTFYGCSGFDGCLTIPDSVISITTFSYDSFSSMYNISEIKNNCAIELPAKWFIEEGSTDYFVNVDNPSEVVRRDGKIGTGHYKRMRKATTQSIASANVSGISNKTYTGKAVTQTPTVTLDGKALKSGTDYTISYANNVNVGTATITITGKDSYFGSITKTFTIAKSDQIITASDITKTTADAVFSIGAKTSADGQLTYTSGNTNVVTVDNGGNVTIKGAGNTIITITASETANYKQATKTISVTVTAAAPVTKSIASATVSGIKSKTYTGKALTQSVAVTLNDKALKSGTDYTLSYENNVNAGTATVTITGTGAYTGSIKKTFAIAKANQAIAASDITKTTADAAFSVGAKRNGVGKLSYKSANTKVVTVDGNGKVTIKGAGKTTITITAAETANYNKATKTINVTVTAPVKKSIAKASISGLKVKTYTGKALTQSPVVKLNGKKLKAGTDYTVSYKNNKNAGTATVTITGKGNYKGTATAAFKIKKAANSFAVKAKKTTYNIKYSNLAKKDQILKGTDIYSLSKKKQGTVSYVLSSAKNDKKSVKSSFAVDKKTGKLTVKKGLKKGTYKVEISVTAAGDNNHNKATKKITISVKVK